MHKPHTPQEPGAKPARRSRRVTVAGTGPATADGPEPRVEAIQPDGGQFRNSKRLSERDRWMLEQKPPHY